MINLGKNFNKGPFQLTVWLFVFLLSFFSNLQMYNVYEASQISVLSTAFYSSVIYGNACWLMPKFYSKRKYILYAILLILFFSFEVTARFFLWRFIYNQAGWHDKAAANLQTFIFISFTAVFTFLFSILYRIALDYFQLFTKQAELKADKIQTELNLLKQQVQPHFLFNTLNNIYYVAQQGSPEAADLIARLSEIIRYFMEESKKEKVWLKDEIALLKNYIELEGIRMRYDMPVNFSIQGDIEKIKIPPLLLLPMTENIYKHGVNKRSQQNFADLKVVVTADRIQFTTLNKLSKEYLDRKTTKTGLDNLGKRLGIIYGNNFTLKTFTKGEIFTAFMELPLNGLSYAPEDI